MKLTDLRGILQYIPQFREKTFIFVIDDWPVQTASAAAGCGCVFVVARY
jgi:hypothetical protein